MPFPKSTLAAGFHQVFLDVEEGRISVPNPQGPIVMMHKNVADALANEYHKWAQGVLAGGMKGLGGNPQVISTQLQALPLMTGWGPGTVSYWTMTTWQLPGVSTGVSIAPPLAKTSADIAVSFNPASILSMAPNSRFQFADRLAGILQSNLSLLTVTQTIISTGITSVVPVS